jgi:hypothetical protein
LRFFAAILAVAYYLRLEHKIKLIRLLAEKDRLSFVEAALETKPLEERRRLLRNYSVPLLLVLFAVGVGVPSIGFLNRHEATLANPSPAPVPLPTRYERKDDACKAWTTPGVHEVSSPRTNSTDSGFAHAAEVPFPFRLLGRGDELYHFTAPSDVKVTFKVIGGSGSAPRLSAPILLSGPDVGAYVLPTSGSPTIEWPLQDDGIKIANAAILSRTWILSYKLQSNKQYYLRVHPVAGGNE